MLDGLLMVDGIENLIDALQEASESESESSVANTYCKCILLYAKVMLQHWYYI